MNTSGYSFSVNINIARATHNGRSVVSVYNDPSDIGLSDSAFTQVFLFWALGQIFVSLARFPLQFSTRCKANLMSRRQYISASVPQRGNSLTERVIGCPTRILFCFISPEILSGALAHPTSGFPSFWVLLRDLAELLPAN